MNRDVMCYVTKVEQDIKAEPPIQDETGDPIVPRLEGGTVLVRAESDEALVEFAVRIEDRIVVGDQVHVRIDIDTELRPR